MKIRIKISLIFFIIIIPILVLSHFFIVQLNKISEPLITDIPNNILRLSETSSLDSISLFIRYYDVALTEAARNYAFTGEVKWKNKYYEIVPKLDEKIKVAITRGDEVDQEFFLNINEANVALVSMEEESIALVDNNQRDQAIAILNSDEYWQQKNIYQDGLIKYSNKRGYAYDDALSASTKALEETINTSKDLRAKDINTFLFLIIFIIFFTLFLGYTAAYYITKPITELENKTKKLIQGNLNEKIEIKSQDEVGQLAQTFNQLIYKLKTTLENIEKRVKERTDELTKINRYMIDRELKMRELKKEIEELKNK